MSSLGKRIVVGAFWSTAENWGRQAANFVVFAVLAWLVGPSGFGFMALALVVPTILAAPVTRGLPEAIVQRPEIDPLHLDSVFWLLTGAGVVLAALTMALAAQVAWAFGEPQLTELVRWTSAVVLFNAVAAVPGAVLKRALSFRLFAVRSLVGTAAGGTVGITMAVTGFGVWSLVGLHLTKSVVEATILLFGGTWRPRWRYSFARCRELFGFARPIVVQSFVTLVNDEIPKVVIGVFLGPHAVGIYALARRLLDLLTEIFLAPLIGIALPAISRVQGEPAKIDRFFRMTIRLASLVAFPAFVGLAAVAPDVVPLVFGPQWAVAVPAVQILMALGLQRTIDGICGATILALGHSGLLLRLNLVYVVLATGLLSLGAQFATAPAVAALVASNLVLLPILLVAASRLARIDVAGALAIYPRVVLAAAVMAVAVTTWRAFAAPWASEIVVVATAVALGAATYGAAIVLVARRDLVETRDALALLRA